MRLVSSWRAVLRYAWLILSGIAVATPLVDGVLPIPPRTFVALSGLTVAVAFKEFLK